MVWNAKLFKEKSIKKPISNIWMKNYKLAKAYYQKYENLLIKINYEIVVDDKVVKLGNWIHNQRQAYKNNKLNEEQIELLNEINMIWCLRAYKDYLKQIDRYLNNESIRYTDDTALNTIKTIKEKVL